MANLLVVIRPFTVSQIDFIKNRPRFNTNTLPCALLPKRPDPNQREAYGGPLSSMQRRTNLWVEVDEL